LIAISGLACALAIKKLLQDNLLSGGSVTLFGTPAEESTSGKTNLVKAGEVNKLVDFAMMLHPGPDSGIFINALALDSVTVEYFGRQSHAGASPWDGINAVDALMQGFDNIALMRQQTLTTNR
jgi:metal-dependent amidase/aminoacylase/carboxypeptidase family protein